MWLGSVQRIPHKSGKIESHGFFKDTAWALRVICVRSAHLWPGTAVAGINYDDRRDLEVHSLNALRPIDQSYLQPPSIERNRRHVHANDGQAAIIDGALERRRVKAKSWFRLEAR